MGAKRLCSVVPVLLLLCTAAASPALAAGSATLLRDIRPTGVGQSEDAGVADDLLSLGGVVLLPVIEPSSGRELWVSDGTDAGTHPLLDLCPGPCPSST